MRLRVFADYSLRLLTHLAVKRDGPAAIAEVAERYAVSRNHPSRGARELDADLVRGRPA
jgi:Rrf2 family nitric oxide-sensitive transcriptional repressor